MLSAVTNDASPSMNSGSVEPLWILRHDGRSLRAELCRSDQAWEVYLFSDKQRFAAHRLGSRELALLWAAAIYDGLIAEGWVLASKAIHAPWGHLKSVQTTET